MHLLLLLLLLLLQVETGHLVKTPTQHQSKLKQHREDI
jgi:hypothetical protein